MVNSKLKLVELITGEEDTLTQFKENINSVDQVEQEIVAFSNAMGGTLLIGVTDNGELKV